MTTRVTGTIFQQEINEVLQKGSKNYGNAYNLGADIYGKAITVFVLDKERGAVWDMEERGIARINEVTTIVKGGIIDQREKLTVYNPVYPENTLDVHFTPLRVRK